MVNLTVVDSFASHCVHVQDVVADVQVSTVTLIREPGTRWPSKLSSRYVAADLVPSVVELESVVDNTVAGWTSIVVHWTSMIVIHWTSVAAYCTWIDDGALDTVVGS